MKDMKFRMVHMKFPDITIACFAEQDDAFLFREAFQRKHSNKTFLILPLPIPEVADIDPAHFMY